MREEERLKGKKENNGAPTLRLNTQEAQRQILSWPQVWLRRQETPQQQVPMRPPLIEGVERTNAAMARPQQQGAGLPPRNPYTMDINRSRRNCYIYGGFGYLARHCRNWGTGMNRRMEVEQDNDNLNGEGGLVSPN